MVPSSFLCLPPEIRLKFYRLLLLSDNTIRMQWLQDSRRPNDLFPAILGTCRLIYKEAIDVLYGENVFRAHRVKESDKNAALIRRAKFRIGTASTEEGVIDASRLANFLKIHPNLKLLKLDFKENLLEDSKIRNILIDALYTSRFSSALCVISGSKPTTRSAYNEARLVGIVELVVLVKKIPGTLRKGVEEADGEASGESCDGLK